MWRRLLSSEAKSTVRAIPVEAAPRARLSGMCSEMMFYVTMCVLKCRTN